MQIDSTDLLLQGWSSVEAALGGAEAIDGLAFETGAMSRRRLVKNGPQLLRLALAWASAGQSCRMTTVWGSLAMGVSISNPSLIERLQKAGDFLTVLLNRAMAQCSQAGEDGAQWDGPPIRLVDGSVFASPGGGKALQHRLHAAYDPIRGWFTSFELTSAKQGENLTRADVSQGVIAVGDRNYAKTWALRELTLAGAFYCVRTGVYSTRMRDAATGCKVDGAAVLARLGTSASAEMPVLLEEAKGVKKPPLAARLIIFRATEESRKHELARIERSKNKHGVTPRGDTLAMAGVMTILTNLPQTLWPPERIRQLYRLRWQIELAFKILKSTFAMRDVPCKTEAMARVWILANLLAAVIAQNLSQTLPEAFPP
jgi:Transposase DDE domain